MFSRRRNTAQEARGWHSPPGMSPAPATDDDAPARGLGQATISLVNMRMSFFRSVDIKLLIVVDIPGWRQPLSPAGAFPVPQRSRTGGAVGTRSRGPSVAEPCPSCPWLPVPILCQGGV